MPAEKPVIKGKIGGRRRKRKPALTRQEKAEVATIVNRKLTKRLEKKYHLQAGAGVNYDYNGNIVSLSSVAQGDTDTTRDGDSLYIRSIRLMGDITVADSTNLYRVIVFQWLDDTTPVASDVLSSTYLGTANACNASYHHDQRKKFRIMFDKRYVLDSTDNTRLLIDTKQLRPFVRKIQYTAATTTGTNKIWGLFVSDSSAVSHPSLNYVSKMNFNDA